MIIAESSHGYREGAAIAVGRLRQRVGSVLTSSSFLLECLGLSHFESNRHRVHRLNAMTVVRHEVQQNERMRMTQEDG